MKTHLFHIFDFLGKNLRLFGKRILVNLISLLFIMSIFILSFFLVNDILQGYFYFVLFSLILVTFGLSFYKERLLNDNLRMIRKKFENFLGQNNSKDAFSESIGITRGLWYRLTSVLIISIFFFGITYLMSLKIQILKFKLFLLYMPIPFIIALYSVLIKPIVGLMVSDQKKEL